MADLLPPGMSPERAAKRERERIEGSHMREAALRYLALTVPDLESPAVSNEFIALMITFRQVAARHRELVWAKLPGCATADLLHDVAGLVQHALPGNGTLMDGFWPRFGGER